MTPSTSSPSTVNTLTPSIPAPVCFTARLQYPLEDTQQQQQPDRSDQILSLFRNPFFTAVGNDHLRCFPDIFGPLDTSGAAHAKVHDGVMETLIGLYGKALQEDFENEFLRPNGQQIRKHVVLSGHLTVDGTINTEQCSLATGRVWLVDGKIVIEY